jgi:hypothetical protein
MREIITALALIGSITGVLYTFVYGLQTVMNQIDNSDLAAFLALGWLLCCIVLTIGQRLSSSERTPL